MGVRGGIRVRVSVKVSVRVTGNAHDTEATYQVPSLSSSYTLRYICITKLQEWVSEWVNE